jgi:hypothetical protein
MDLCTLIAAIFIALCLFWAAPYILIALFAFIAVLFGD